MNSLQKYLKPWYTYGNHIPFTLFQIHSYYNKIFYTIFNRRTYVSIPQRHVAPFVREGVDKGAHDGSSKFNTTLSFNVNLLLITCTITQFYPFTNRRLHYSFVGSLLTIFLWHLITRQIKSQLWNFLSLGRALLQNYTNSNERLTVLFGCLLGKRTAWLLGMYRYNLTSWH